jgi:hypothetical protein
MSPREAATRLVDSWDRDPQGPWPELEALREALAEEERKKKWAMAAAQAEEEAGGFPPVGLAALAEAEKAEAEPTVQRESVTDALSIVESYGPWGADLNDAHRRQIVLAEEVLRLRHVYELAVRGRAEMRDALRREREAEKADVPHHCTPEQIDELIGVLDDHANPEPGRRYDDTDWRSLANVCALVIRHLRSHTHPAAALRSWQHGRQLRPVSPRGKREKSSATRKATTTAGRSSSRCPRRTFTVTTRTTQTNRDHENQKQSPIGFTKMT